ncbi:MAG: SRPBCC domain-containing protein [Planctomycetaceae bacterium]|nr:SRPBCC domain-containing protein [Planctomycetaceae bacterium]
MPADPQASESNLDNPVEIIICRTVNAPRVLVWKAWTDPSHVGRWWGPAGFTTTTHSMDFRPGGSWRYTMHGPDGQDYDNRIDYLEIVEPSRLVYQLGGEVEDNAVSFRSEVTFEQVRDDNSQTRITLRSIFPTPESRDFVINNYGAVEGGRQHLANLEDYLATMSAGPDEHPPFSIGKVIHAPRERVWLAWTKGEQIARWFGPTGATIPHATMDLRIGGMFHYRMSHPNGMDMWGRWVFRTINRPDTLEFVSSFSNAEGGITPAPFEGLENYPAEVLTTISLLDHAGIGKGTLVTIESRPLNGTQIQCDFFANFHGSLRQGWSGTLQQLAALFEQH